MAFPEFQTKEVLNKVYRVDFMDSSGDYVKIPRLLNNEIQTMDID